MNGNSDNFSTPQSKPWGAAIATFLVCLALGPPIGGLVFAASVALMPALANLTPGVHSDPGGALATVLFVGLFAVPFSYLLGSAQAAATGLAFAAYGWLKGRPPLWFAVATAAVVFAGAMASGIADEREILVPMVMVHAVPALLCWLIVRTFWFEARS